MNIKSISKVNRTLELINESFNLDPVTGYPVETPKVREKLLDVLKKAISENRTAVFIDADIDNLKGLNDLYGHKSTNLGIKTLIQEKESNLVKLSGIEYIFIYRPQAGGDEFKVLIVFKDVEIDKVTSLLCDILETPVKFKPNDSREININCSYGTFTLSFKGNENPGSVLQEMEIDAENKLELEKSGKIIQSLKETLEKGKDLSIDEYIKFISKEWGSKRLSKPVLEVILLNLLEKSKI